MKVLVHFALVGKTVPVAHLEKSVVDSYVETYNKHSRQGEPKAVTRSQEVMLT